ncbi:MAG TPA: ribonuclease HII [Dehalococcoidia bacterium]|nr:ribonuclease HII [Dehalococcoidia bacterium]
MASKTPTRSIVPTLDVESALWADGRSLVCGVDEVGRGALAGPVVAAAVVLPRHAPAWLFDLRDSKALLPQERERLAALIRAQACCWSIGSAAPAVIDSVNILQATFVAMERAVAGLRPCADVALVDGSQLPRLPCETIGMVDGDAYVASIAAASILAKVARDGLMTALDRRYPGYGFAAHKGYSCPSHRRALLDMGVTPVHRRTFASVRSRLCGDGYLEHLVALDITSPNGRGKQPGSGEE